MVGAIVGVVLAILTLVTPVPVVIPVFSIALGANALVKERRAVPRKPPQRWLGIAAVVLGAIPLVFALLRRM